jgi:hypothetical protein
VGSQNFSGNSCYDPDASGTGSQPANYDDFTAHYNRYRVIASRITVVTQSLTATSAGVQNLVLYPYNVGAAITIPDAMAQPYSVFVVASATPAVLSTHATTLKIVGRDPRTTDALGALYNANPADIWYWGCIFQTIDGSSTSTIYVAFNIDYEVEFFDRLVGAIDVKLERMKEIKRLRADRTSRIDGKTLCVGESGDSKDPGKGAAPSTPSTPTAGGSTRPAGFWRDMDKEDEKSYQAFLRWKDTKAKPP